MVAAIQSKRKFDTGPQRRRLIHPVWLRFTHWLNATAVLIMLTSGWQIYDASPLFANLYFPPAITLGGWLGGALLWHFAAMWLLVGSFLLYLSVNVLSGRMADRLFPVSIGGVIRDLRSALRGALAHDDLSRYNMVQKFAYLGVIAVMAVLIVSGAAIWKPVQLSALSEWLGGYESARVVHFVAMVFMVAFLVLHVAMSLLVPRALLTMVRGR